MKKLIVILLVLLSCESDSYIFPEHGEFGKNVLRENIINFEGSDREKTWYSLTTNIPVKIVIEQIDGYWYIGMFDQWEYTDFNGSQEFISEGFADKRIFFRESGTAIIKYYKNNNLFFEKQIYWELN